MGNCSWNYFAQHPNENQILNLGFWNWIFIQFLKGPNFEVWPLDLWNPSSSPRKHKLKVGYALWSSLKLLMLMTDVSLFSIWRNTCVIAMYVAKRKHTNLKVNSARLNSDTGFVRTCNLLGMGIMMYPNHPVINNDSYSIIEKQQYQNYLFRFIS